MIGSCILVILDSNQEAIEKVSVYKTDDGMYLYCGLGPYTGKTMKKIFGDNIKLRRPDMELWTNWTAIDDRPELECAEYPADYEYSLAEETD